MNKIKWCLEQKKGIELVEPNDNLCEAYIKEANDTLKEIKEGAKWSVIMGYYACYNAFYSILMKAGIKCEIHDCTLKLMKMIKEFSDEDYDYLVSLKVKRIDVQYYLKKKVLEDLSEVKNFVLKCDQIRKEFDLNELRGKIKDAK
ncbi:hypothetical protein HON71_04110 [Candidatus Woesearchaeota archaeon]|jgi:hypothetical protein|nr:hypothetical protein [Candidatus Woesearchaeota archaeon]MBT5342843.1 hypothetical protein [Candidatus Woesearchaeota archaeon]